MKFGSGHWLSFPTIQTYHQIINEILIHERKISVNIPTFPYKFERPPYDLNPWRAALKILPSYFVVEPKHWRDGLNNVQ